MLKYLKRLGYSDVCTIGRSHYDLTDFRATCRMFKELSPNYLFHLAARVGGIGANQERPGEFYYDNLLMGAHIVEGCRLYGVEKLIVAGTTCSYPSETPLPFREEDLWSGYPERTNAPYGIAKRALIEHCAAYRRQYGLRSVMILLTNLYGPGDNFHPNTSHVIPAVIRKCTEAVDSGASSIECWGDGSPTRDFLYVEDAAQAMCLAAQTEIDEPAMNVGSGREISIQSAVEQIAGHCGFHGSIHWDTCKPSGQLRRCLDTSRARRVLRWEPTTTFETGVARTVEWFKRREKVVL